MIDVSSLLSCLTRERLVEGGRILGGSLPSNAERDRQVAAFLGAAPAHLVGVVAILQELRLRQRVDFMLVVCPAANCRRWRDELWRCLGRYFEIVSRDFVARRWQERGFAVNPWGTYSRFMISQQQLRRPEYRDPLLQHLGKRACNSLLILKRLLVFRWMRELLEVFFAARADSLDDQRVSQVAYIDAGVGNLPFIGGKTNSTNHGGEYSDWPAMTHDAGKNDDLSAHFFRFADRLIRRHGAMGFIATNKFAQGETRTVGLQPLAQQFLIVLFGAANWPQRISQGARVFHSPTISRHIRRQR